jgi:hypothetical protein
LRRAAKIDANQAAIVDALHAAGCTVQSLASVGCGCPDLLVGKDGITLVIEVKSDTGTTHRPAGADGLTDDQKRWYRWWRGNRAIVETPLEALEVVRKATQPRKPTAARLGGGV